MSDIFDDALKLTEQAVDEQVKVIDTTHQENRELRAEIERLRHDVGQKGEIIDELVGLSEEKRERIEELERINAKLNEENLAIINNEEICCQGHHNTTEQIDAAVAAAKEFGGFGVLGKLNIHHCEECGGSGKPKFPWKNSKCSNCNGRGYVVVTDNGPSEQSSDVGVIGGEA